MPSQGPISRSSAAAMDAIASRDVGVLFGFLHSAPPSFQPQMRAVMACKAIQRDFTPLLAALIARGEGAADALPLNEGAIDLCIDSDAPPGFPRSGAPRI